MIERDIIEIKALEKTGKKIYVGGKNVKECELMLEIAKRVRKETQND